MHGCIWVVDCHPGKLMKVVQQRRVADWRIHLSKNIEEQRTWQRCLPTSTYHHEKQVWHPYKYSWTFVMQGSSQFNPHFSHLCFASSPYRHLQTPTYSSLSKADQCKQYQRCTSGTWWGALAGRKTQQAARFNTHDRKSLLCSTLVIICNYKF